MISPPDLVLLEIRLRQDAAVGLAGLYDQVRDPALVEGVGAAFGNLRQRLRKVRLHQPVAHGIGLADLEEDLRGRRVLGQPLVAPRQRSDVALFQNEALGGQPDRGGQQLLARPGAVCLARHLEARDRAGGADGKIAVGAGARDRVALRVQIHRLRRGQRRALAEVEEGGGSVGHADRHEAAAAQVTRGRIDHGQRIAHRHGRIDGIAAGLQHVHPNLGREVLGGHDHPVLPFHRRRRGRESRCRPDPQRHHEGQPRQCRVMHENPSPESGDCLNRMPHRGCARSACASSRDSPVKDRLNPERFRRGRVADAFLWPPFCGIGGLRRCAGALARADRAFMHSPKGSPE